MISDGEIYPTWHRWNTIESTELKWMKCLYTGSEASNMARKRKLPLCCDLRERKLIGYNWINWFEWNVCIQAVKQVTWHGKGDYFSAVIPDGGNSSVLIHQLSQEKISSSLQEEQRTGPMCSLPSYQTILLCGGKIVFQGVKPWFSQTWFRDHLYRKNTCLFPWTRFFIETFTKGTFT